MKTIRANREDRPISNSMVTLPHFAFTSKRPLYKLVSLIESRYSYEDYLNNPEYSRGIPSSVVSLLHIGTYSLLSLGSQQTTPGRGTRLVLMYLNYVALS